MSCQDKATYIEGFLKVHFVDWYLGYVKWNLEFSLRRLPQYPPVRSLMQLTKIMKPPVQFQTTLKKPSSCWILSCVLKRSLMAGQTTSIVLETKIHVKYYEKAESHNGSTEDVLYEKTKKVIV